MKNNIEKVLTIFDGDDIISKLPLRAVPKSTVLKGNSKKDLKINQKSC